MLVVEGAPSAGGMQPWNGVLFPAVDADWRWSARMSAALAESIPAIGRGLDLISGQVAQMPLETWRGDDLVPTPDVLVSGDPDNSISWTAAQSVVDYLLHGNAVAVVTSWRAGLPRSWAWVPAEWVTATKEPGGPVRYWVNGEEVPADDIVHVKRRAQRHAPWLGIGIVEQYQGTLRRFRSQTAYESSSLDSASVPSVAVISPNPDPTQEEVDRAQQAWKRKYGGPAREPGIFPAGTQVLPLSWSPSDQQLTEARKLSLTDAANLLNLDGYWLGATGSGYSYKSPAPMYLNLIRQTIGPILVAFEDVWSAKLLPAGIRTRFNRAAAMQDDIGSAVWWVRSGMEGGLFDGYEARRFLGLSQEASPELVARWKMQAAMPRRAKQQLVEVVDPEDEEMGR